MADIKCSECGGMVSNLAATCPHCGAPTEDEVQATPDTGVTKPPPNTRTRNDAPMVRAFDCVGCSAKLSIPSSEEQILTCEYCDTRNWVELAPQRIRVEESANRLDSAQQSRFANLVKIIETSYAARNYPEAYSFCNQALAVDARSSDVWTHKALCRFWIILGSYSGEDEIVSNNALEIRTYLNAAKEADPDSQFYVESANRIAFNLYWALQWKLDRLLGPDTVDERLQHLNVQETSGWHSPAAIRVAVYIMSTIETCFDISADNDTEYLKYLVKEYRGHNKILWVKRRAPGTDEIIPHDHCTLAMIDPIREDTLLVERIRDHESDYDPPEWNVPKKSEPKTFGCLWAIIISSIIIIIIALMQ